MPLLLPLDLALPVGAIAAVWWLVRGGTRLWLAYGIVSLVYMTLAFLIALAQGYSLSIYVIVAVGAALRALFTGPHENNLSLWQSFLVALVGVVLIPTLLLLAISQVRVSIRRRRGRMAS